MDKQLPGKIKLAKQKGFKGVGFATNCSLLDETNSKKFLESGLDTIICSIDGLKKETHEAIRIGTNFNKIIENVELFLNLRNHSNSSTKVLIRFIRQKQNWEEWPEFFDFWYNKINPKLGDNVIKYDIHNWGSGEGVTAFKQIKRPIETKNIICNYIFERLVIYTSGDLALCCIDENGYYRLGNVLESDPLELFNGPIFTYHRNMMKQGKILELEHCQHCDIPYITAK